MRIWGLNISIDKRDVTSRPTSPLDDRWYQSFPFSQASRSGAIVNPETALTHPTVYACVQVVTQTIGIFPLILYKSLGDRKRERATLHPLYNILRNAPNPNMTAMEFREMMTGHLLLRGNAYAQIIRDEGGDVSSLWPLHPGRMEVLPADPKIDPSGVIYKYTLSNGSSIYFDKEDVLHLRGPSSGGLVGRTPIDCFKEVIGQGLSMEEYLSNFYGNNASPTGILTLPQGVTLSDKAKDRLRTDWQRKYSGNHNAKNIAVLEEGATWQSVGMTASDAEFIMSDKMNALKICGVFRVPPHKVGILDQAKFNNDETQNIDFITDTMMPHLVRWEQVITRDLLRYEKPGKYYAEFLVAALLRGDTLERYKAYAVGRQWGWLSVNDIRAMENENEIEGGDIYLQPLNMIDSKEALDYLLAQTSNSEKQPGIKTDGQDPGDPTLSKSSRNALSVIMERLDSISERVAEMAKKAEKTTKIEENLVKTEEKHGKLGCDFFRSVNLDCFSEIFNRALTKESQASVTAKKREKFGTFEEDFIPEHTQFVNKLLRANTVSYAYQVLSTLPTSKRHASVEDVAKRAIDETIKEYYAKYRDSGEKVFEYSAQLAKFLTGRVEELCLPKD